MLLTFKHVALNQKLQLLFLSHHRASICQRFLLLEIHGPCLQLWSIYISTINNQDLLRASDNLCALHLLFGKDLKILLFGLCFVYKFILLSFLFGIMLVMACCCLLELFGCDYELFFLCQVYGRLQIFH